MWTGDAEGTYGEIYEGNYGNKDGITTLADWRIKFAKESRRAVLEHPLFKKALADYTAAIGLDKEPAVPAWIEFDKRFQPKTDAK